MIKHFIRNGTAADWDSLAEVFHHAVREGAGAYTQAQRAAWSPVCKAGPDWSLRMSRQAVWVAEVDRAPIGFMTLELNGYLDCAYITPDWQGKGVFRQLYMGLEKRAREENIRRIYTYASLHAHGAFLAMGFDTIAPETVEMGADTGIWLPRFAMEKLL